MRGRSSLAYRIEIRRDIPEPAGEIEERRLHAARRAHGREDVQNRERKPGDEEDEEDDAEHLHRATFARRLRAALQRVNGSLDECLAEKRTAMGARTRRRRG